MSTPRIEIAATMTISEAAQHWQDPRSGQLRVWADAFDVRLDQLHVGHIKTYQDQRSHHASGAQIDAEVDAILALLQQVGLGSEFRLYYHSFADSEELTLAEFNALPESVRKHIEKLRREVSQLNSESESVKRSLRKATWGRSR